MSYFFRVYREDVKTFKNVNKSKSELSLLRSVIVLVSSKISYRENDVLDRQDLVLLGRVRSIVKYDKTYGIFLRGFANICAVSNSVIYDRELLWWSTGTLVELTDASLADIDRNGNQSMPFRFFFSVPVPFSTSSSLFQHEKEIKNKLSTDSLCIWATQCWVIERNHSRTCEDRPYCRKWSWKLRRGEGRLKGFSCVGIFVMRWSSTKNHRSLLDFSGVGAGEEQEKKQSLLPKKGRLSSEKVDTWLQGKKFRWVVVQSGTSENKTNQKIKNKRRKERRRKKGTELDPSGKRVPDQKNLPLASW